MKSKKRIVFTSCLILVSVLTFIINKVTINSIYLNMIALLFLAISLVIAMGRDKDEIDIDEKEETQVLDDKEMEDVLLKDGEYSYDDYDKVCCPECGAFIGENVGECDNCGYGKPVEVQVCPKCGKQNEDNLDFCAFCNYNFKTKKEN